jgi:hypothetical protein
MFKVYNKCNHMKRKDWDVVSYLSNALFTSDFVLIICYSYKSVFCSRA